MKARTHAGTGGDERSNLARVLDNALREADACAGYALEAEAAGDGRLAGFFRDVQETYRSVAGRAEKMLGDGGKRQPAAVVRSGGVVAEEDPGDVSDR